MKTSIYKKILKESLYSFLEEEQKYYTSHSLNIALEDIISLVTQGKMLRGCLFLETLHALQSDFKMTPAYINIAMAIELIHTGFLIHDDIMDHSDDRRGQPTIHSIWKSKTKASMLTAQEQTHYGYAQAICIGDMAIFFANQLIAESSAILGKGTMSSFLQKQWIQVCFGQMLDMKLGIEDFHLPIDDEEILEVYRTKTAQYTFSVPLRLATMCLGIPLEIQDLVYTIGIDLGILFQIQDDYLDLFGDPQVVKKSLGQDIREKKKTLYLCKLYNALPYNEKKVFLQLSQSPTPLDAQEIAWLQKHIKYYAIDEQVDIIYNYYEAQIYNALPLLKYYPDLVLLIKESLLESKVRVY